MKIITRYKEIESFLFSQLPMYQRTGPKAFKKDLSNIRYLSKVLSNPEKGFKSIHIAGTNGKGSCSFFLASALSQAGLKVGLYTSPHYKDYRERIKINGEMIGKSFVKKFVNQLIQKGVFDSEKKPSFFEISVAMAFSYFKEEQVDIAVIETGLGGRLDSTNIIKPELSVITNIGYDHMQFLGNTLPLIAKEKAGIIKKHTPVIIGRKQKETTPVFEKIATKKGSPLQYANSKRLPSELKDYFKKLPEYQLENMKTSYVALKALNKNFVDIKNLKKAWTQGLKKWGFVGRYMRISNKPLIIFDSAHNTAGLEVLFKQIAKEKFENLHIVLAVVNDKDLSKTLNLFPKNAQYYFSNAKIPRALAVDKLQKEAQGYGLIGKSYSTVNRAFSAAKRQSTQKDLVLVTGSIFTIAELV